MNPVLRKTTRTLHLWLALASGMVIFVVAVTGCIYCFESELRGLTHKDLYEIPVSLSEKQPVSVMMEQVREKFPNQQVKYVSLPADPAKSAVFALKNKTHVFVNPYSGALLGSLHMEKEFFGVVLQLHRNLLLGEPGKKIIGVSALVFFVMIVSGIMLWWPRKNKKLGSKFFIKKEAGPARRTYDLHSILGFYASWFLLISVLTGLIWNYKWAENSMYWLTGSKKQDKKPHSVFQQKPGLPADNIAAVICSRYPGTDVNLFFPEDSIGVYRAVAEINKTGLSVKRDVYSFDRYSGRLVHMRLSNMASTGDKVKAANYNLHTGKAFGLLGQLLMFCASLVAASLPVTGLLMWRNRLKKKKSPSRQKAPEKPMYAETA